MTLQMSCRVAIMLLYIFAMMFRASSPLFAEEARPGIVVWELRANEGVKEADVNLISSFVANQVAKYSGRNVIAEADIQTILKGEEARQKCGAEDTSCIAEIGAALGVPEAVSGDIGRLGRIWMLNLRLLNIRSTTVIKRSSRQVEGEVDDLVVAIPLAVAELFGIKLSDQPGTLAISTEPEGVSVSVDSQNIGRTPLKHRLTEGSYTLAFTQDSYLKEERAIDLKPGERREITITMQALLPNPYKLYGHVTFWSGVGLVAIGGILNWQAGERQQAWEDTGSSSDKTANRAFMGSAVTGYALGGALIVTGTVLWILDPGDEAWAEKQRVSVGAGPDGQGGVSLSLAGRW